jgi:predicted metal-dependent phosphoesterase TrpH
MRYDLQVHTDASPCSATPPEKVTDAAERANLDGIVVTDHDTLANVDCVRECAPDGLDVVSGVEVTTTQGHLLAIDVTEAPPRTDPLSVVDAIHDQGGIAVLSHPFDALRQFYDRNLPELASVIDGIEATNSRCVRESFNRQARAFAAHHGLAITGGSDAHFPMEIGRAATEFDGSLRTAIREGTTTPRGRGRYLSGHVATKLHQGRRAITGWLP